MFYFSKEEGSAELRVDKQGTRVTVRAVRTSAEHRLGRYRVHAFLGERPLGREEMQRGPDGAGVLATTQGDIVIVE